MIDWAQVKQLEEDVGADEFSEVLIIFIEEVEESIDTLRTTDSLPDDEMASVMHFLKGSALNLGFADFATACAEGEKKAKAGSGSEVSIPAIVELYDDSKVAFFAEAATHTSYQEEAA